MRVSLSRRASTRRRVDRRREATGAVDLRHLEPLVDKIIGDGADEADVVNLVRGTVDATIRATVAALDGAAVPHVVH